MNRKLGMFSSLLTLLGVLGFAISMASGNLYWSYFSSIFIALGFVPMICSFTAISEADHKAVGYTAIAFSAIYAVLVSLVYFAQLTTVHLSKLSEQVTAILDYQHLGSLFFYYDLFGYAFMSLATFFIALTIRTNSKTHMWLKSLLMIHGVFAISCIMLPMLGIFKAGMEGGNSIGFLVLGFWCAYFTPICILSYLYFYKHNA